MDMKWFLGIDTEIFKQKQIRISEIMLNSTYTWVLKMEENFCAKVAEVS